MDIILELLNRKQSRVIYNMACWNLYKAVKEMQQRKVGSYDKAQCNK